MVMMVLVMMMMMILAMLMMMMMMMLAHKWRPLGGSGHREITAFKFIVTYVTEIQN